MEPPRVLGLLVLDVEVIKAVLFTAAVAVVELAPVGAVKLPLAATTEEFADAIRELAAAVIAGAAVVAAPTR